MSYIQRNNLYICTNVLTIHGIWIKKLVQNHYNYNIIIISYLKNMINISNEIISMKVHAPFNQVSKETIRVVVFHC